MEFYQHTRQVKEYLIAFRVEVVGDEESQEGGQVGGKRGQRHARGHGQVEVERWKRRVIEVS